MSGILCLRAKIDLNCRAVGRSENPGVPALFGGHNLPPLVEIGLTDLPNCGGATRTPMDDRTVELMLRGFILCSIHK